MQDMEKEKGDLKEKMERVRQGKIINTKDGLWVRNNKTLAILNVLFAGKEPL